MRVTKYSHALQLANSKTRLLARRMLLASLAVRAGLSGLMVEVMLCLCIDFITVRQYLFPYFRKVAGPEIWVAGNGKDGMMYDKTSPSQV